MKPEGKEEEEKKERGERRERRNTSVVLVYVHERFLLSHATLIL